jgi:beta-mannanase
MSSITFIISAVLTVFVLHSFDESNITSLQGDMAMNTQTFNEAENVDLIQPLSADISSLKTGLVEEEVNTLPDITNMAGEEDAGLQTSSI